MSDQTDRSEEVFVNKSLLIIEDSLALRQILCEIFVNLGCQVLAANHEDAIPHLRENGAVDLVLLGLDYPLNDGKKVFQEIQNKTLDTKLMIISSFGARDGRELLNCRPDIPFLKKPFTLNELTNQAQILLLGLADGNLPGHPIARD